jgi:hypothetical protein
MPHKHGLKLAWRIGPTVYQTDESFEALLGFFREHRDLVDEVALFENLTHHLYFPVDWLAQRADLLRRRLAPLHEMDLSAGINVVTTIGHMDEAWDYMPASPLGPTVGHNGAASRACACPNTADYRRYIRDKYRLMAQAGPQFIWVDDDLRMEHHGAAELGCFCPTCLDQFSQETHRTWTRQDLVAALNDPAGQDTRRSWIEHNRRTLESLLTDIQQAVHEVDPKIATGLMTIPPSYQVYSTTDGAGLLAALKATKIRPGASFYTDERPFDLYVKVLDMGRQLVGIPAKVADRQYELEDFPYITLGKSVSIHVAECTLSLAAGHNGIAFNAIGFRDGRRLGELGPLMAGVRAARPFWQQLVRAAGDWPLSGLWPAWNWEMMARRPVTADRPWLTNWGKRYDLTAPTALAQIGLPLTVDRAEATILHGRIAEVFSDQELTAMLAGPVLMDLPSLEILHGRGLGDLTGVRIARTVTNGVKETLTGDALNGEGEGTYRFAYIEHMGSACGPAAVLEPLDGGVRVLAELRTFFDDPYGPCETACTNRLGGRVVVATYAPWANLGTAGKREQMLNVADWLISGLAAVRVRTFARVVPLVRLSADRRRGVVVLLNAGNDALPSVELDLRVPPDVPLRLIQPGRRRPSRLEARPAEGGVAVTLPGLPAWAVAGVVVG